jgi:hypothetical protein
MRNAALAAVLVVGCASGGTTSSATYLLNVNSGSRVESVCVTETCGGTGEAWPATLIGLALVLGVSVVHETLRGGS